MISVEYCVSTEERVTKIRASARKASVENSAKRPFVKSNALMGDAVLDQTSAHVRTVSLVTAVSKITGLVHATRRSGIVCVTANYRE